MHCLRRHQTTKQIIFIFIIWISSDCDDIDYMRSKVEIDEFGYLFVGYPFAETMGLPGLLTLFAHIGTEA
jgi:hypothetical protein